VLIDVIGEKRARATTMRTIYSDGARLFFLLHFDESRRGASPLEPIATVSAIALQQ
jgi:hypothetical protein